MRHSTRPRRNFRVRLACVKHAASVQSEPESNSPVQICCKDSRWTEIRISKFFPLALHLSKNRAPLSGARSTSTLPSAACQLLFSLSGKFFPNLPSGAEASPPPRNFLLEKSPAPCQELFPGTSGKSPAPAPGGNPFGSRSRPAKAISTQSTTKRQAFLQKKIFFCRRLKNAAPQESVTPRWGGLRQRRRNQASRCFPFIVKPLSFRQSWATRRRRRAS